MERGETNLWIGRENNFLEYSFPEPTRIRNIRLVFDSDLNREYHNMPCNYPLVETKYKLPETLIKKYKIIGSGPNGEQILDMDHNHQRFVCHQVDWTVNSIRFVPLETHGSEEFRVFDFEIS